MELSFRNLVVRGWRKSTAACLSSGGAHRTPPSSTTGLIPFLPDRGRRPAERAASDFFTGGSRFFALGPAIHWPIFNAGRIRDNIEVQDLRHKQALFAYRQMVLLGLEEVENALVTHREARLRFQELCEAEGAELRAVALAHDRAFSWCELMTPDPEAAKAFYGTLFGWTLEDMDIGPGDLYPRQSGRRGPSAGS